MKGIERVYSVLAFFTLSCPLHGCVMVFLDLLKENSSRPLIEGNDTLPPEILNFTVRDTNGTQTRAGKLLSRSVARDVS